MVEVSGNVLGAAVANGSKQRQRTRAVEDSGRGGNFVGCEESASHLVKPQQHKLFCARREGQTLPYIMQ
jgi:hypothetical protein